jgi:hypothetical protein
VKFGVNYASHQTLLAESPTFAEPNVGAMPSQQLKKTISVLDITDWQRAKLRERQLHSIVDVLPK